MCTTKREIEIKVGGQVRMRQVLCRCRTNQNKERCVGRTDWVSISNCLPNQAKGEHVDGISSIIDDITALLQPSRRKGSWRSFYLRITNFLCQLLALSHVFNAHVMNGDETPLFVVFHLRSMMLHKPDFVQAENVECADMNEKLV